MAAQVSFTGPIERAIVRRVRQTDELKSALNKGGPRGGGIHQDIASRRERYPYFTYSLVTAPILYDHGADNGTTVNDGTIEIHALYDLTFWSDRKVEAEDLDSILGNVLQRKEDLEVEGQTVILLQRVGPSAANGADNDVEGRRYVRAGGTYEIWTVQPAPKPEP
jgi:hypothetical protein